MQRELEVATHAARLAADAIAQVYAREHVDVTEKHGGKGPVTEADLAANRVILEVLKSAFAQDGFLSEETKDSADRLSKSRVWVIDPLDGTRDFVERRPEFVVSIGLAIDGKPAVGVLVNPATREEFTGIVGQGAWYGGQPCHVTSTAQLADARLVVSGSEVRRGEFARFAQTLHIQPVGSVAYKFGLVAAGLADAVFTPKPRNEWDLLGGVACLLAAGGRASDRHGEAYVFNRLDPLKDGVVGTNGALHDAILEIMR